MTSPSDELTERQILTRKLTQLEKNLHATMRQAVDRNPGVGQKLYYAQKGQYGNEPYVIVETASAAGLNPKVEWGDGTKGRIIVADSPAALMPYIGRLPQKADSFVIWETTWEPTWRATTDEHMVIYTKDKKNGR